jgi:hypothetical protein
MRTSVVFVSSDETEKKRCEVRVDKSSVVEISFALVEGADVRG